MLIIWIVIHANWVSEIVFEREFGVRVIRITSLLCAHHANAISCSFIRHAAQLYYVKRLECC